MRNVGEKCDNLESTILYVGFAGDHSNDAVYCVEFDLSTTEPSILWISIDPLLSTGMPRWHDKRYSYVSTRWVTQIYCGCDHLKLNLTIFEMNNAFINCCVKIIKCQRCCPNSWHLMSKKKNRQSDTMLESYRLRMRCCEYAILHSLLNAMVFWFWFSSIPSSARSTNCHPKCH